MKVKIQATIRTVLSLLLIFGVYKETGIFTAIFATLVFLGFEIISYTSKKNVETADYNFEQTRKDARRDQKGRDVC